MDIADMLQREAWNHAQAGKFRKAAERYEAAAALYHDCGDLLEEGICLLERGRALSGAKRYDEALEALTLAENVFLKSRGTSFFMNWLICGMERGLNLYLLGRYPEALRALIKARRAFWANGQDELAMQSEMVLAWAKRDYGLASSNAALVDKSITLFDQLRLKHLDNHDHSGAVQCDIGAGAALMGLGRFAEAAKTFDRGAQFAGKTQPRQYEDCIHLAQNARRAAQKSQRAGA